MTSFVVRRQSMFTTYRKKDSVNGPVNENITFHNNNIYDQTPMTSIATLKLEKLWVPLTNAILF